METIARILNGLKQQFWSDFECDPWETLAYLAFFVLLAPSALLLPLMMLAALVGAK